MSDKIKFFSLGGLDENGKNMSIIEINNDCSNYVSILVSNYNFEFENGKLKNI